MSSPNAKLLLLLMLPFSLKMFPFLEFMTGVWSFAAFLTAWIIERLMEFSLLRILPFFAFHGTRLLQIYSHFVSWRLNFLVLNYQNDALIKRLTLFSFCNHPSTHFSFLQNRIKCALFSALHQVFKFKRFSWNISHIYANVEFKGFFLWYFDWQFFFSIVHLSLPLTITHFSTYYIQHYDNKKVVE